jgi:hypothetical protein
MHGIIASKDTYTNPTQSERNERIVKEIIRQVKT